MRISDWSSDVCSSDLANETHFQIPRAVAGKFSAAIARTVGSEDGDEPVHIEPSEAGPRENARENRSAGPRQHAGAPSSKARPPNPDPGQSGKTYSQAASSAERRVGTTWGSKCHNRG